MRRRRNRRQLIPGFVNTAHKKDSFLTNELNSEQAICSLNVIGYEFNLISLFKPHIPTVIFLFIGGFISFNAVSIFSAV